MKQAVNIITAVFSIKTKKNAIFYFLYFVYPLIMLFFKTNKFLNRRLKESGVYNRK